MIIPWELFKSEQEAFRKKIGDYDFNIYAQPKQRSQGATKFDTRTWEKAIFEAAEAQAPKLISAERLGCHIIFLSQKPTGDLSNCIKTIEDALNRRAYHDDKQIDHLNVIRYCSPEVTKDRICVKIYER